MEGKEGNAKYMLSELYSPRYGTIWFGTVRYGAEKYGTVEYSTYKIIHYFYYIYIYQIMYTGTYIRPYTYFCNKNINIDDYSCNYL